VILSSPILLWQLWQFIAPGLYEHEKRYTRSFVAVGSIFFIAGSAFCYFIVIQRGLSFLLNRYEVIAIQPLLQIGDYLSLVSRLVLAFGIMFEMPVLAFFLARVGVIDHRLLIRHSRYALIAIALFAAVLTPPDLIAQIFMMLPLMLLYALSIAVAYLARYRMNRLERRME
jgi:sec-independent protein translocase protein TatC